MYRLAKRLYEFQQLERAFSATLKRVGMYGEYYCFLIRYIQAVHPLSLLLYGGCGIDPRDRQVRMPENIRQFKNI